ncbi:hypothetical protein HPO96_02220 [Kribbella sandramycini]|uniref:Uncharacterized protein n=1 Tax=Kribbella sandramycini TaxID=60450 RepID=A0A7Y4KUQ0_9ACTN|nr:hypothetical protein [Kribbella sandramycini]MBB6568355.1 hypothetical protein [Kribbella sandramycini]NOL39053.1 hypothetical protein [Kribbella sandramycini]
MSGEREEFLHGLQAEVEGELQAMQSAVPDAALPVEQWIMDPAEEAVEQAGLTSLLGAVKALEEE